MHNMDPSQKRLQREKLVLDIRNLETQLSRRTQWREDLKALTSLGGVVTAFVAIFALIWSVFQGLNQLEITRQTAADTRFTAAVNLLSDPIEAKRSSGVLTLQGMLAPGYKENHKAVLLALAAQLGSEPSPLVRASILDILRELDDTVID